MDLTPGELVNLILRKVKLVRKKQNILWLLLAVLAKRKLRESAGPRSPDVCLSNAINRDDS